MPDTFDLSPAQIAAKAWLDSDRDVPYGDPEAEHRLDVQHHNQAYEIVENLLATVEAQQEELASQRAELTGGLSEHFKSFKECYDTPADHYREMARRLVDDRDALKHRSRMQQETISVVMLQRNEALAVVVQRNEEVAAQSETIQTLRAALIPLVRAPGAVVRIADFNTGLSALAASALSLPATKETP